MRIKCLYERPGARDLRTSLMHRNSRGRIGVEGRRNDPTSQDDEDYYEKLMRLLSVLSKKDPLQIFKCIVKGVNVSSLDIPKSNRYRILDELLALRLIEKDPKEKKGAYKPSPFGEFIYEKQVVPLVKIAMDKNLMDVVAKFVLGNKSPSETFEGAVREITRELLEMNDPKLWNLSQIEFVRTLEEFDLKIASYASSSKSEFYLALRSLGIGTVQALMDTAERGVKVCLIYSDWRGYYSSNNESMADPLADLLLLARNKVPNAAGLTSENPNVLTYRLETPHSFVVSDNLRVAWAIGDPEDPNSFFGGVALENEELAAKLMAYWKKIAKI